MSDPEVVPPQPKKDGAGATALGFALIAVMLLAFVFTVRAAYRWFAPQPSSFALSAYFVDEAGKPLDPNPPANAASHLRIQGDVYKLSHAIPAGRVRINVATSDRKFEQSVSTPLLNGHFQTDDPALNSVRPGVPVVVTAYASFDAITEVARIELSTNPPTTRMTLYIVAASFLLSIVVWFVIAFTGRETSRKNRAAIILSYGIIIIFLAVPIFLPSMLLREFPDAVDAMVGEPAGLVVTCTSSQEPKQHQWALNIGGYSFVPKPAPKSTAPVQPPVSDAAQQPVAQPSTPTTTPPVDAASAATSAAPAPSEILLLPTASSPGDCREFPPAGSPGLPAADSPSSPPTPTRSTQSGQLTPPLVEVQGGLVVPLYVIILSVIGGAINMTRKVPGFQMEGDSSDVATFNDALGHVSYIGSTVIESAKDLIGQAPPPGADPDAQSTATFMEQATQIDTLIYPLVLGQLKRRSDSDFVKGQLQQLVNEMHALYAQRNDDHPAPFRSYDEWFASHPRLREVLGGSWRVELLNQYMYLISAPFLAIVTYYLLDLLGLSKPGVVVVLSFSVGLISEKIVSWILGVASGYLHPPNKS